MAVFSSTHTSQMPVCYSWDSEDRKGNENCPTSHNHWTANGLACSLPASCPHSPTEMHTTWLPLPSGNSAMWVTALLDHLLQGMRSPVTFVPLYWQSPHSLWNNHLSMEDNNHPPPILKPRMSQQKLLCHSTETDSRIPWMGYWPQFSSSPTPWEYQPSLPPLQWQGRFQGTGSEENSSDDTATVPEKL